MIIHAYAKTYLYDLMGELGAAFDFACKNCGMSIAEFGDRFIASGIAAQIERGNPSYLAGMSGLDLAARSVEDTGRSLPYVKRYFIHWPGQEYWTGWIMAYLQWYTGWSFSFLAKHGYDAQSIYEKYNPYHEANEDIFVEDAIRNITAQLSKDKSRLHQQRVAAGLTQKELSERSGVKLRMIQAIAKVLACTTQTLLD